MRQIVSEDTKKKDRQVIVLKPPKGRQTACYRCEERRKVETQGRVKGKKRERGELC